jgi:hypothetical protein
MIGLRWIIAVAIPDVPKSVETLIQRQQYSDQLLARTYKLHHLKQFTNV